MNNAEKLKELSKIIGTATLVDAGKLYNVVGMVEMTKTHKHKVPNPYTKFRFYKDMRLWEQVEHWTKSSSEALNVIIEYRQMPELIIAVNKALKEIKVTTPLENMVLYVNHELNLIKSH